MAEHQTDVDMEDDTTDAAADLYRGPAGYQSSRPAQKFPMDQTHSLDSQRNEGRSLFYQQTPPSSSSNSQFSNDQDNYGGDGSQPSALPDTATFIIKVDQESFPDRWKRTLEVALQKSLLKMEGTPSVHRLELMNDQSYAEVQIIPSTALEAIKKLRSIPLTFKNEKKEVTALICPDEMRSVTVPLKSRLKENRAPSLKVISSTPVTAASEHTNNVDHVSATNSGVPVPLYLFWYMNHAYRKELEQIEKQHEVSVCAEVSVSINPTKSSSPDSVSKATEDFHKLVQGCVYSFSDAAINHNHMDSDIVKLTLHAIQSEEAKMMFTMSASNCLFFGPKKFTDMIKRQVNAVPQPSALLDTAKFIIKVDRTEPFPERWRVTLQKAVQSWLMRLEEKPSVLSLELMDDPSCAEVQITPSTALEAIKKLRSIPLTFKHEKKEVTALICPDEMRSVTVPLKSRLKENRAPSLKVISSTPVTAASEHTNNVDHVSATNSGVPVPLYLFWYMNHAYRKELEQIEKQHGVSVCAEVSVSINPTKSSSPDSVSKATEDFHKLVQGCVYSFSDAAINHNHMDSDIVKLTLHAIQSEEAKMMFTMSASNCLFFGPKKFTDMIKRQVGETRMESKLKDKSSKMSKDNHFSPQSRSSLDMDTKDLPAQLEMDTVHWDLMKLSYKDQLSQLETKYGMSFHEDKRKNNLTITVKSKRDQHVNLESHAIRALTRLYQKLASAAVTCELKNSKDEAPVASALEKLQQQLHCVVLSRSRLVGLPEHLGPAIADIEKTLQKSVFDDKKKKSIGYSGDIPHARGIKWH